MRITSGEDVGILDEDGNSVIRAEYQYIGMFGENGFAPVEKDGEWYYIDTNGYKRRQPDETYEYLGTFNEGVLPAKKRTGNMDSWMKISMKRRNLNMMRRHLCLMVLQQ